MENPNFDNSTVKRMNVREFRELGYLQELNRRFLHPLGLAIEILRSENGEEALGGVWDYRDDTEGLYYDFFSRNDDDLQVAQEKADYINEEQVKRFPLRKEELGFIIEPLVREEFSDEDETLDKDLIDSKTEEDIDFSEEWQTR